jgi:hypothetical protein
VNFLNYVAPWGILPTEFLLLFLYKIFKSHPYFAERQNSRDLRIKNLLCFKLVNMLRIYFPPPAPPLAEERTNPKIA